MELSSQEEWSWLVAIDLFLGGLGGGLFLLFQNLDLPPVTGLLSLGLVILGGLVLLAELGHPLRAWRALARPQTSWISRGMISVFVFIIAGLLYIAPSFSVFSWLPWSPTSSGGRALGVVAGICAFLVTLYPGFVLSASPSIPFWNSPLLPVLFFSQSLLGASGLVLLLSPFGFDGQALQGFFSLAALLIVANFILMTIHLWTLKRSGLAAREAVSLFNRGSFGWTFRAGVVLIGMILPFIVVVWVPSAVVLAGAFILVGSLLFRYCVLKAGVYVPFALI
ncbi:MAG: polysulfide reductase NrfD [Deltaproteobacteria bacterium]|nr:polysulfide reductase NrfD [Deltaproteobacteria bacterium]